MIRKHPLSNCEECPLREVGKFVPSLGPDKAKVAFVGEAPGVQEARKGIPFTGPSGKLLDTITDHQGIRREETFLTNACLCRPPDNATPPKSAILACRERLIRELQDRGVDTVVALGNSAAESILGQSGVTKLRVGPGRKSKALPGVRVIPTLHPAAALRQADLFPYIVTDIGKVNTPWVTDWEPPQYIVADDKDSALSLLDQIDRLGKEFLVIDIEVDIDKDVAFDHPNRYGMLCVGIGYDKKKVLVLGEEAMKFVAVRDRLGETLRAHKLAGQNLKFDLSGLYPVVGPLEGWFDTMLASYCLDERPGVHSLDFQCQEYLGMPNWKGVISRYVGPRDGYGVVPRDVLYQYNAYDVAGTYELLLLRLEQLSNTSSEQTDGNEGSTGRTLRDVHDFLMAASNELMYVELNGIAVDLAYLDELTDKYLNVLEEIEEELNKIIGFEINPRSPMQVKNYLREAGVRVPRVRNQKGEMAESTNEESLNEILEKQAEPESEVAEFIRLLLKYRREQKLYGTYIKGIRKRLYRGRVYPTFLLHGTTTGRLACRNPNLQNVPRESSIRKMFVPAKPEHTFIQTDYSQAELRVLSFLAKDKYFRDIFNGGERDLFDELTPILYPDLPPKDQCDPKLWKETRIRVKAYVYGLSYGREAGSIASEYGISMAEASRGMTAFFDVIPEIVEFRDRTKRDVLAGKDLVTPWGRRRRFMLITDENVRSVMNEALAFLPQSTASDICLQAMTWIRRETKGYAWIRNIVHDSILIETHKDDVEEIKNLVEKRMIESAETIVGDYVKFAVESETGPNWGVV